MFPIINDSSAQLTVETVIECPRQFQQIGIAHLSSPARRIRSASSVVTTVLPTGHSARPASFKCAGERQADDSQRQRKRGHEVT